MILPLIVGVGVGAVSLLVWLDEKKRREEWEQLSDKEKRQRIKQWRREREEEKQRKKESKQLIGKILRRARFRCENCGGRQPLEVYYIISPYDGGECTYDNLQALCGGCPEIGQRKVTG